MAKGSKGKSTASSRRFAFSSFRERVESIKIEPNINLNKRVHDYVETSHFLATLEHWKEVNISGNFTDFLDKVEQNSQTLAQILHHQNSIFDALYTHIEVQDSNSIQPLLELLSQFVHDLGPDFMPFYPRFLKLVITIAESTNPNDLQNNRNSSNILEWCFNCLAFAFKYLSKTLIEDLVPTLEILLPLLLLKKKTYISRFCAEALSFLVRKMKIDKLDSVIDYCFNKQASLIEESESYEESLIILFSEAMINTKGSFHSKSSPILFKLIENSLSEKNSEVKFVSITSDILLRIINHGSSEGVASFYLTILKNINEIIEKTNNTKSLISITSIMVTLTFADSGRKIPSWEDFLSTIQILISKIETISMDADKWTDYLVEELLYLFTLILRNCDIQVLTKFHVKLFNAAANIMEGKYFLPFIESNLEVAESKLVALGASNYIQGHINRSIKNSTEIEKISLFLNRLDHKKKNNFNSFVLPPTTQKKIIDELKNNFKHISSPNQAYEVYWRLLLCKYTSESNVLEQECLVDLLHVITDKTFEQKDKFTHDLVAALVDSLGAFKNLTEKNTKEVIEVILSNFNSYQESSQFIASVQRFLSAHSAVAIPIIDENFTSLILRISKNLSLAGHESRYNSIQLIIELYKLLGKNAPNLLSQISIIEQIPLTLNTGRDILLRTRNLSSEFKLQEKVSEVEICIISNFLFGLLSVRFQPSWTAALEGLPNIAERCSQVIWELVYDFINKDYSLDVSYHQVELDNFLEEESSLIDWQVTDQRLRGNFSHMYNDYYQSYREVKDSILKFSENLRSDDTCSSFTRTNAIKVLYGLPFIGESHSKELVKLVLHETGDDIEDGEIPEDLDEKKENMNAGVWTLKERNELVGLFGKFKNLKTIYKSEMFYEHMLKLLCNKHTNVQKMALEVILNYKGPVRKYSDNLRNLLDDTIFRDELSKFITLGNDSTIEEADKEKLMPLVLRILFGRVQGTPKSNSKANKKFAVITVLPNFPDQYIIEFLKLGSDRIKYQEFFSNNELPTIDSALIRKVSGFINLLNDSYKVLGYKFTNVLETTIEPLVYSLILAQYKIEHITDDDDLTISKSSRGVRQMGMKCLSELFVLLGDSFNWDHYIPIIHKSIIGPRLVKFADENLQQASSLLKIITSWIEHPNLIKFLFYDDFSSINALMGLVSNPNIKESVVIVILDFCISALRLKGVDGEDYFTLLAIIVSTLLKVLPSIIKSSLNNEVISKSLDILLLLIDGQYIEDNDTRAMLLDSLNEALDKPASQVHNGDRINILLSMSSIIDDYECSFDDILPIYQNCSKAFRTSPDRRIREQIVEVFNSIGNRFTEYELIADVISGLNSYSNKRMEELDFEKRLNSFQKINEELYQQLTPTQWLPIINCSLFFINDENELAIRTNATAILNRYVDCYSEKENEEQARPYIRLFKDMVLPHLRTGLRKSNEAVQTEYIGVLSHTVQYSKYFVDMEDMKVLLFGNDEEANFFKNVNHIQLHRRQRAVKRVAEYRNSLSDSNISHYILPIIERYAISEDEKYRNIANESVDTICLLVRCVSWNQFKALFRRYSSNLKSNKNLKNHVNLIVAICKSFMASMKARRAGDDVDVMKGLPNDQLEIDDSVTKDLMPLLLKVLTIRDDETIVARAPLSEGLTSLVMCISEDSIESQLPGILTSTCQVMRSRSEELRDAVRKTLGRIASLLGARYFKFILKELKTALSRGSQIHVLSFTMHSLLATIQNELNHGDLDDAASLIVGVIMEDIFGAAGQEKDAEGYHSTMKEVKFKKSFDSGEILSSNISLTSFVYLVEPVKQLLKENISLKIQNKLDELLRRYALGLNHNDESSTRDILLLCYELHKQTLDSVNNRPSRVKTVDEKADHFLVKLDSRPQKTQVEYSQYIYVLQKFAFELLRTALSRHDSLLTVSNLEAFIPLLENGLMSANEGVTISCLRLLHQVVRLPFSEEIEASFKSCARRALNIIKDCPSTNSEVCQASLKFLSTIIRHKPNITLKHTAISYVLVRLQPDLEEPNRQGLAFNFLKAVVSQHIMIPEVYDTMEKVSKIMIVNHSKEIRDMARSIYFLFLMEYDQGRGKLEKQFKFLVNNLGYATQAGRQSVMELIHLIIMKSGGELLSKLSSSFFVALANVIISDDSSKCREMATTLISSMLNKLGSGNVSDIEKYCLGWMSQSSNLLLRRCGLNIYKIYISQFGVGENADLDSLAIKIIEEVLLAAKNDSNNDEDIGWEYIYTALNVFSTICSKVKTGAFTTKYISIWKLIFNTLLYPHSWVRLLSSRLTGLLLNNLDNVDYEFTNYEIQTIAYRLLHQLGAPGISEELGNQVIKNLVIFAMRWEKARTLYEYSSKDSETEDSSKYKYAIDYLVARTCAIVRQENNYKDSFYSKKSSVQLLAMLIQIISTENLPSAAEKILLALNNITELNASNSEEESDLVNISMECMQILEEKMGVSEYTRVYTKVKQIITLRRQDRRAKRAQMAVTAPDISAKRKFRKHERSREKRKHEKDENGFYRSKKNRFNPS